MNSKRNIEEVIDVGPNRDLQTGSAEKRLRGDGNSDDAVNTAGGAQIPQQTINETSTTGEAQSAPAPVQHAPPKVMHSYAPDDHKSAKVYHPAPPAEDAEDGHVYYSLPPNDGYEPPVVQYKPSSVDYAPMLAQYAQTPAQHVPPSLGYGLASAQFT